MEVLALKKTCTNCKQTKELIKFGKEKRGKYGRRSKCKECRRLERFNRDYKKEYQKSKDRIKENTKRWKLANPEKVKEARIVEKLNKYQLSLEDYLKLKKEQNNLCFICKQDNDKELCIDHCHLSGKIRGLLCHKCNSALGFLNDDIYLLKRAVYYLERFVSG